MSNVPLFLNGIPCLGVTYAGWQFSVGPQANRQVFAVHDSEWSSIEDAIGTEVSLQIGSMAQIDALVLVEEVPNLKPHWRSIAVADRRYWAERKVVLRDYNIRRKQNRYRLAGAELVQLKSQLPVYGFIPSTLREVEKEGAGGQKTTTREVWTAETMLEDISDALFGKKGVGFEVDSLPYVSIAPPNSEDPEDVRGWVTVNDVRIRNNGVSALGVALQHVPGAACWVDAQGVLRWFDTTDLGETHEWLQSAGPETVAGGVVREINRKGIRPAKIVVYFEREIETFCRSLKEGEAPDRDRYGNAGPGKTSEAELVNVLPLPDPETTVGLDTLSIGTWAPFKDVLESWNGDWGDAPDLTYEQIRLLWMTGALEAVYGRAGDVFSPETNNAGRVGAVRAHWRTSYMIDPLIMERLADIKDTRLAIIDDVTRTRAVSTVYATYALQYAFKGIWAQDRRGDPELSVYQNVDAYPDVDGGVDLEGKSQAASAVVRVLDRELGIVHIEWRPDPFGQFSRIVPGYLSREGEAPNNDAPEGVFRALRYQNSRPMLVGGRVGTAPGVVVSSEFQAGLVFTALPQSPNGKARFHAVTIKPGDINEALASEFNVQQSEGPTWELFAPPSLITARWGLMPGELNMETYTNALNELLGISKPKQDDEQGQDQNQGGGAAPPGANANEGGGGDQGGDGEDDEMIPKPPAPWKLLNDGHMAGWAKAEAVKVWASLADRLEGNPSVHLSTLPGDAQKLQGNVVGMSVGRQESGRILASVTLEQGGTPRLDPVALTPQWARPQILGVVLDGVKP